ncbi:MAG: hypothetical protein Nkreftii_000933 [Candidatus Nitrospira kreftii]|uniref:Uncharacterized protein n=1 Tax=Candidatus Nitrospira kreftii TaxID=2652173 RepID=A0A7S8FCB8_9BACT|nr:MAG: hypothetical protein Nkreftii_000933 [Candidatus Nitrospira kreftii]
MAKMTQLKIELEQKYVVGSDLVLCIARHTIAFGRRFCALYAAT